jgi:hypothetical protein
MKLLRYETPMFCDDALYDNYVVCCYVLKQHQLFYMRLFLRPMVFSSLFYNDKWHGGGGG